MNVELACNMVSRLKGLIGRKPFDGALLLAPCNDIHTFGMKLPIDVAFVDLAGMVLESHREVPP